jgi:hypothetical protein
MTRVPRAPYTPVPVNAVDIARWLEVLAVSIHLNPEGVSRDNSQLYAANNPVSECYSIRNIRRIRSQCLWLRYLGSCIGGIASSGEISPNTLPVPLAPPGLQQVRRAATLLKSLLNTALVTDRADPRSPAALASGLLDWLRIPAVTSVVVV